MAINVPATGVPIDMHQPLKIIFGIELCARHYGEINIKDWLGDEKLRELFRIQARISAGNLAVPPDFDRAFISKVNLKDPAYLSMKNSREPQSGG